MKRFLLSFVILCFGLTAQCQTNDTDSIFQSLHLKFSAEEIEKLKKDFDAADSQTRGMMLQILSMPMSSKAELIDNYENRYEDIHNLKNEFEKLVPKDHVVFLEITTSEPPLRLIENIDLQIFKKNKSGTLDMIDGDWDIKYGSAELDSLLQIIGWDAMTFSGIKNMMQMANCISIQNGNPTEIGFARSGLGKYFYLLFPNKILTVPQIKEYNDGCEYIYYKKNIVLRYTGGMAGPQCFTD